MRILVLGGTQMLGRDFVEKYTSSNSIVIANRGITAPSLFKDIEHVKIDRGVNSGCDALGILDPVDAVIDFSCYSTEHLENTIDYLPAYRRYVYVSTMSVFDSNTLAHPDPANNYYWYCVNKINCEKWIRGRQEKNKWSVVRPCAVIGENDYTNRFFQRDGNFFWKCNGQQVGEGTIPVSEVSIALWNEIFQTEFREVNL